MNLPWTRIVVALALLAAVGAVGWTQRDSALFAWLRQLASSVDEPPRAPPAPGSALGSMVPAGKAVPGLNKCRSGSRVTYTDQPCPPGSRATAVEEGGLTVLPPAPRQAAPAPADKRAPHVRDLLLDGDEQTLRERRVEQAIGR